MSESSYKKGHHDALGLLAQREHTRYELMKKLSAAVDISTTDLLALLDELEQKNHLSDERYAQARLRSMVSRGQGPLKIQASLREKGVAEALITEVLTQANIDWLARVSEQRIKKFGDEIPTDFKERARQSRFLAGRGFYVDTINAVFHEKF